MAADVAADARALAWALSVVNSTDGEWSSAKMLSLATLAWPVARA